MPTLVEYYNILFDDLSDPRVKDFFLMSSPLPTLFIIILYLSFTFSWGPRFMKNRKPYDLEKIMVLFNAAQIVICAYIVVMYTITILPRYSLICEPVNYSNDLNEVKIAWHVWLYFMIKIADLLDTVFFILRKKNNQVTFLHVYHHTGMCVLGWIGTKYVPGGHGVFLGYINSIVHMIMYSYYLLTAWDKSYKTNLWWKKHITQIQIIQFAILMVYFGQILVQPNCGYPKWCVLAFLPQNITMVVLFTNFYIKNYCKNDKKTDEQKKLPSSNNNNHSKSH